MTYYELAFTFMVALSVIVMGVWAIYEIVQCFNWGKEDVLPPPRKDRIARGGNDGWKVELLPKRDER